MGRTRPGDMGFDIVHFNLHKTFTQPHGGGGPGSGPIAGPTASSRTYDASRREAHHGSNGTSATRSTSDYDKPKTIGRLRGFQGNYGSFVRSYAYIRSLAPGPAGCLGGRGPQRELPPRAASARGRRRAAAARLRRAVRPRVRAVGRADEEELGLKTLDLAKRLLDHGFHPPTVYFPLLVDEALLIEPTETETKETLDAFADAIAAILREGREDPEIARNAPYTTPVRRLDEAGAAKRPVIRQPLGDSAA
jgi:glycine dehydrogenase subunit 2